MSKLLLDAYFPTFAESVVFRYVSFWPLFRKYADGVVFVYAQDDEVGVRKLDSMYNYFVTQRNLDPRACLVCTMLGDDNSTTRLCKYILSVYLIATNDCWNTLELSRGADSCGNITRRRWFSTRGVRISTVFYSFPS